MAAIEGSVSVIDVQPTTPSSGEGRCQSAVCADSRSPPHFEPLLFSWRTALQSNSPPTSILETCIAVRHGRGKGRRVQ